MNENKICFITCVNDEKKYQESLYYIAQLNIPFGYEIECVAIRNAQSMASGYNKGMETSDAKYKVYLHQDLFILNKNFIKNMLSVFISDCMIGMMGVIGTKYLPADGIWFNSIENYGGAYDNAGDGSIRKLECIPINEAYSTVIAVDGLIFATQYDVRFRDDLFDGWHFYDISQCLEFSKQGYKVVVPHQEKTWCLHDCGIISAEKDVVYNKYRNIFLNEYSKILYPLVSILIPTYNRPKYFKLALESAINQTYRNIEIIVGDDSTNNETETLISNYLIKYKNIKYYHNVKNLGQFENDLKLMSMSQGEYVNFLMDDDLFAPNKIEMMISCFFPQNNREVSLVASHRAIIDKDNNIIEIFCDSDKIIKTDTLFDGAALGDLMLKSNINIAGEPSTVLFKKSRLKAPFGTFNSRRYYCNVDQASWYELLSEGKAIFINDVLSFFRWHDDQQQKGHEAILGGAADYAHEILSARQRGFLIDDIDYFMGLSNCKSYVDKVINQINIDDLTDTEILLLKECTIWSDKLSSHLNQISTET